MDPFIGEIRAFAGRFAPSGWAFCNGQLLSVSQYQALFAVIHTTYGGDGTNTFAVPDLRAAAVMHQGAGPGLTPRELGVPGGSVSETLSLAEMPAHDHEAAAYLGLGSADAPGGAIWAAGSARIGPKTVGQPIYTTGQATAQMQSTLLAPAGGGGPHNNVQPFLGLTFIIALDGLFPVRP